MAGWMKKNFSASGVTEYPVGPEFDRLQAELRARSVAVLLLDVSGSMNPHLQEAIQGSEQFLREAVAGGYHVGVILWSHEIKGVAPIARDATDASRLLRQARAEGGTRMASPLQWVEKLVADAAVPGQTGPWTTWDDKVVAVFCDGGVHDEQAAQAAAEALRGQGVRILARGLGTDAAHSLGRIFGAESADATPVQSVTATSVRGGIAEMARGLMNVRGSR